MWSLTILLGSSYMHYLTFIFHIENWYEDRLALDQDYRKDREKRMVSKVFNAYDLLLSYIHIYCCNFSIEASIRDINQLLDIYRFTLATE